MRFKAVQQLIIPANARKKPVFMHQNQRHPELHHRSEQKKTWLASAWLTNEPFKRIKWQKCSWLCTKAKKVTPCLWCSDTFRFIRASRNFVHRCLHNSSDQKGKANHKWEKLLRIQIQHSTYICSMWGTVSNEDLIAHSCISGAMVTLLLCCVHLLCNLQHLIALWLAWELETGIFTHACWSSAGRYVSPTAAAAWPRHRTFPWCRCLPGWSVSGDCWELSTCSTGWTWSDMDAQPSRENVTWKRRKAPF